MADKPDITVNLPRELLNTLSEVIHTGLQRAHIAPKERQEIRDWWTAEKEFIQDEIDSSGE